MYPGRVMTTSFRLHSGCQKPAGGDITLSYLLAQVMEFIELNGKFIYAPGVEVEIR